MEVTLLAAVTADGFIGRSSTERSFDWTSDADKQFYVSQIKKAGVVIMGSKTFATFNKYPKGLQFVIYTSQPENFTNPKPEVIKAWGTNQAPGEVLKRLEKENCSEVMICGGSSIYTMFMKAGLITRMLLTVEPHVFGKGVGLFSEQIDRPLRLVSVTPLSDQSTVMEYRVA